MTFKFTIDKASSQGRLGTLTTPHGTVQTPAFIFCATKAAMKSVTPVQMRATETQIILANTYHLMLQPGGETVAKLGGLQKMTGWNGPMLTDSGGFQIFSLGHGSVANEVKGRRSTNRPKTLLKISEQGAKFKSYIDGRTYFLTPEESVRIQRNLGADLIVVLDECTPFHVEKAYTQESMRMSHRWGLRSLEEWQNHDNGTQKLYGIVQGGVYPELRQESCEFVNEHNFFGIAVGGSLGADKQQMHDVVSMTMNLVRKDRPVHLLGIGGVSDIFSGVRQGIDTFDCVHPTRLARHGGALVKPSNNPKPTREHINLRNGFYAQDNLPIEPDCACETCSFASKGYLHHLLKAQEAVAMTLISIHNIYFINKLMQAIRQALKDDTIDNCQKYWSNP
ncbi:MAG: tRNA guanosine(34) transglycosylase Tgt [Proteobacteria bacterium]|nr:tRNA guanosine(34) transglycosylase Tgt [Pseudomonadota bacterium]